MCMHGEFHFVPRPVRCSQKRMSVRVGAVLRNLSVQTRWYLRVRHASGSELHSTSMHLMFRVALLASFSRWISRKWNPDVSGVQTQVNLCDVFKKQETTYQEKPATPGSILPIQSSMVSNSRQTLDTVQNERRPSRTRRSLSLSLSLSLTH